MSRHPRGTLVAAVAAAALIVGCGGKSTDDMLVSARESMAKHDYSSAAIELKTVLQQSSQSGEARYLLGSTLLEQGLISDAVVELKKAAESDFDPQRVLPRLARALVLEGKSKEVIASFAGREIGNPTGQAELYTALTLAYSDLGRPTESNAALELALKSDPSYPGALLTRARVLVGQGKLDEALKTAERARIPNAPNGEVDLFRGAVLAVGKRDDAEIVKAFESAATDPVQTLRARAFLIEHYMRLGAKADAKKQLAMLEKTHPKSPQKLFLDAVIAFDDKDYARTEEVVDLLLRVAPDSARLLVLSGAASLRKGSLVAAETKLGRVVQTTQGATAARQMLAETYLRMGQGDKALKTLKVLLDLSQPDADSLALAAQANLLIGDPARAEALFSAASKLRPGDPKIQTALALVDLGRGKSAEAFEALRGVAKRDASDAADLVIISARLRRGEFGEALAAIATLDKKQPGKAVAAHLRGVALRGKGDLRGARLAFEAALKLEPAYQASMLALAQLDESEGKPDEARARLARWVEVRPNDVPPRMALLDVKLRQGAPVAELMAGIDEALRIAPGDPAPHLAKILEVARRNDSRAAVLAAQEAMAALPNNVLILDAAGMAYAAAGEYLQAVSVFNKMASLAPGSALPFLRLAGVNTKRGNAAAARSNLTQAFEVEPMSAAVHRHLLAESARTKDFKIVMAAAKTLQQRFPQQPVGFELEGAVLDAQRRWDAAAAAYRSGLSRGADTRLAFRVFDSVHAGAGRAAAYAFASEWLAQHPDDGAFHAFLGDRARVDKDLTLAQSHYRRSLQIDTENGGVMNNLAWVLGQTGNAAEAITLAERASTLYPRVPQFLDTLAVLLAGAGQSEKAIAVQRRLLALRSNDARLKFALARMLVDAGQKQEARALLGELAQDKSGSLAQAEVQRLLKLAS